MEKLCSVGKLNNVHFDSAMDPRVQNENRKVTYPLDEEKFKRGGATFIEGQ